jgi:integrase/recombinase XerD
MSELYAAAADYLAMRRKLGFTLKGADVLLADFVDYLRQTAVEHITVDAALSWATRPQGAQPIWWHQRLGLVRGFAQYMKTMEELTEIPPQDLLPAVYSRITPYLYGTADIAALMRACRALNPALRAATYQSLIGLLAVSGLRISEALNIDRDDLDMPGFSLLVRHSKAGSSRRLPLHATTVAALAGYAQRRDLHFPVPVSEAFFVSIRGTRMCQSAVNPTFRELIRRADLEGRGPRCRPRIHDLRHSFAVTTILGWYRQGVDVDAHLPLLSAILGHVDPSSTYWYLQASPELFALTADRLGELMGGTR